MNPTEIYEALEAIAASPFDPLNFGYDFADATDNARATVSKLRSGTTNKTDLPGGVLLNRKFHFAPAEPGRVEATLTRLRESRRTEKHQPAILIAADGETIAAEHRLSGDTLHCAWGHLGDHFGFFLPAAGRERYQAAEDNPVDVKATGKLAKLYDALLCANPHWGTEARRHDMNQFMTRLIFCLFAEDVSVFPESQFSRAVFTYGGDRGEHAREVIVTAFTAMNLAKDHREGLPAWAQEFEYVNGGLFAGAIDAPAFDQIAFRYLRDVSDLDWREINPDIFGSMIQSIVAPKARAELGMHYTSVPNIMKALGPLFLDDIDAEIEKSLDRPKSLRRMLTRLAGIRVFDPACGSGNFLVVAYRELRAREIRILAQLAELEGQSQVQLWSNIQLSSFYGIEITDFATETAKLALFIAENQANRRFREAFGRMPAALPLRDGGNIVCANALQIDWTTACPPLARADEEVYIVGNPPYYGAKKRTSDQNLDMAVCGLDDAQLLDYVSGWLMKAAGLRRSSVEAAFVATSSICQGEQVAPLWTRLLARRVGIRFAYRPFRWRNSAADVAGLMVTIVGLSKSPPAQRRLFDEGVVANTTIISPYLIPGSSAIVTPRSTPIGDLPTMVMGSNPVDGKRLILEKDEAEAIAGLGAQAARFLRPYLGGDELIYDTPRACIWIEDHDLEEALTVPAIATRVEACRIYRASAGRDARRAADKPHRFCYSTWRDAPALMVPNTQSEDRLFIPAAPLQRGAVINHAGFAVYDPPAHLLAIIGSSLHRAWLATVGGRLDNRFRYAVRLVYNTFPTPNFTPAQKEALARSSREILRARYAHHPMTLAALYDPKTVPDDLRAAHQANDELLERMYIDRPFRNDTERLEHLFKLYANRVRAQEAA